MNRRSLTIVGCALVTALALILASCGTSSIGSAKGAGPKANVTIALTGVNPNIYQALGAVAAPSGSKAFMFVTSYNLSITDYSTGASWYNNTVTTNTNGPGSGTSLSVALAPDTYYNFSVMGYNSVENSSSPTVTGYLNYVYVSSMGNDISINLLPYANYLDSSNATSSGAITISQSVFDQSLNGGNGAFPITGGEKWFYFYPTDKAAKVTVTPASGYVYAAMYDSYGNTISAGVSPSFAGGSGSSVTIEGGVTSNSPVYVGYIDIIPGTAATTPGNDSVDLTIYTSSLADDIYEDNDSMGYSSYLSTSPAEGSPTTITGLKAYDSDWFYFWANSAGTYTVTMTDEDPSVSYSGGMLAMQGTDGSKSEDWDQYYNTGTPHAKTFTVTQTMAYSGWVYINARLQHTDPNFGFQIPAADYSLTLSFTP